MLSRMKPWLLLCGTFLTLSALIAPPLQAQSGPITIADTDDDEIVVIGQDSKVYGLVYRHVLNQDPELLVGFVSPDAGWTGIATGDFNGDGDHEIVAIGGTLVKVFDPGGSTTPADFTTSSGSSFPWTKVATGDVNGDNRDEIVLLRRNDGDNEGNITIYSPTNSTATTWTKLKDEDFITNWRDVAVADFENNGRDDLALIYYEDPFNLFELREGNDPADLVKNDQDASVLSTDQEWFDVVAGQVRAGGRAEWVGTRSKQDTLLLQEWTGSQISTIADINYSPAFEKLALGDIYGDGDEEVVGLRNVTSGNGVQVWNPAGAQYAFVLGESIGTGWLGLAVGNVDKESQQTSEGKPYEEIVLVKPTLIRIYAVAQSNNTFYEFSGSYLGPVAVGNLNINAQEPFSLSETTIIRVGAVTGNIPAEDFIIRGESAPSTPINWQATVIPGYSWPSLQQAIAQDPQLQLTITAQGLSYSSPVGTQTIPGVDWVRLSYDGRTAENGGAITGTTPSSVTTEFITNPSLTTAGKYEATILIDIGPQASDRFHTIDITVWIFDQLYQQYVPIVLK